MSASSLSIRILSRAHRDSSSLASGGFFPIPCRLRVLHPSTTGQAIAFPRRKSFASKQLERFGKKIATLGKPCRKIAINGQPMPRHEPREHTAEDNPTSHCLRTIPHSELPNLHSLPPPSPPSFRCYTSRSLRFRPEKTRGRVAQLVRALA